MMKVIVLFSLVALCFSATISSEKHITVGEDGTIAIIGEGRALYISRSLGDPRKVNLVLINQDGLSRKIQIDDTNNIEDVDFNILDVRFFDNFPRDQLHQSALLAQILREYQGVVDETTYRMLLNRIQNLVDNGLLHTAVMEALTFFDQMHMVNEMNQWEESRNLDQDVFYPGQGIRQMHQVSGMVPDQTQLLGLNKYRNVLPNQGLLELTPYQRTQMLLQLIKQRQYQQGIQQNTLPIDEQELSEQLTQQQILQQIYQHQNGQYQTTPLNRFLNNVGVSRGQNGVTYPVPYHLLAEQQTVPQQQWTNKQVFPQQWSNKQVFPQQWSNKQVFPQQWTNKQVNPMQWVNQKEVYPQQWSNKQVFPQQWANKQVYPQQWANKQVYPQQWANKQVYPQQWANQKETFPQQLTNRQVYPQQWTNKQVYPQQWSNKQVFPQQWTNNQVIPQQWSTKQVYPQQWANKQVYPQRWTNQKTSSRQIVY